MICVPHTKFNTLVFVDMGYNIDYPIKYIWFYISSNRGSFMERTNEDENFDYVTDEHSF